MVHVDAPVGRPVIGRQIVSGGLLAGKFPVYIRPGVQLFQAPETLLRAPLPFRFGL